MLKFRYYFCLLLIAIAPSLPLTALAQEQLPPPANHSEPADHQRRERPSGILRVSTDDLEQTFDNQRRPRGEGIRRGAICAISPATDRLQGEAVIWSDRPLFLWKTDPTMIRVVSIQVYNPQTNEILWDKDLAPADQRAIYDSNPLAAGQIYIWELTFERQNPMTQTWELETLSYSFQVLPSDRRDPITAELQQYADEERNNIQGQGNASVAINQANYLMQQGLLSDGLQILYAIEPLTPELTETLQDLTNRVCTP